MARATNDILIIAGDADGNLGDRAILYSMVEQMRLLKPDIQITGVLAKPGRLPAKLQLHTVPRGLPGLFRLISAALRADLVLCGGGGLFQDDDSLIKMPYWAARVLLMRACCHRVTGYSLGVGPLSATTSRLCARIAFSCMDRVSTRDPIARTTAQTLTSNKVEVVPDPALLLSAASAEEAERYLEKHAIPLSGKPLIGVAVRRWFPARRRLIPNRLAAKFRSPNQSAVHQSEKMCKLLARVLDQLARQHDAHIVFLPTYNVSHEGDDRICQSIQDKMNTDSGSILCIDDPALYKAVTARLAVLLGGRMHPTIFAAASGTPIVGLAYNPKFTGFFSLLGLDDYVMNVVDFVNLELTDDLVAMVSNALRRKPDVRASIIAADATLQAFNRRLLGVPQ